VENVGKYKINVGFS